MKKIGLLATLYMSQGLPFGFFTQAMPVLMRKEGWSLAAIGLTSLLALPWALKFAWAPLVDRVGWARVGRRKSWIVPLQVVTALLLAALAAVVPSSVPTWLLAVVLFVNLLAATQDVATDGLAVEILASHERGLANGVQVAGYRLGMIVGGGALLVVYDDIGWRGVFTAMALMIAALTVPVLLFREPPSPRDGAVSDGALPPPHFLRRPGAAAVLTLAVVWKLGESFATAMLKPFLVDRDLDLADVGRLVGTVGFVSGLVGAMVGGALVGPLGRQRALVVFGVLQAVAVGLYAALAAGWLPQGALAAVVATEHATSGLATVALFTCMMDWCDTRTAGTDYTVQASAVVMAQAGVSALAGFSAEALGYAGHFSLCAAVSMLAVAPAALWFPARPGGA